jgi:hypothetical protein
VGCVEACVLELGPGIDDAGAEPEIPVPPACTGAALSVCPASAVNAICDVDPKR